MPVERGATANYGHNPILKENLEKGVRHLDPRIRKKLRQQLDKDNMWEGLKAVLEDEIKEKIHINPNRRSPTEQLLDKMATCGKKVQHLIYLLYKINNYEALMLFGIIYEDVPPIPAVRGYDYPPQPEPPRPFNPRKYVDCIPHSVVLLSDYRALPPRVTKQPPSDVLLYWGEELELTFEAVNVQSYSWYYRAGRAAAATLIPGATTNTLTKRDATFADAGRYYCLISNEHGTDRTEDVFVQFISVDLYGADDMVIVRHPGPEQRYLGEQAKFECVATVPGDVPTYQWWFNPGDNSGFKQVVGAEERVLIVKEVTERDIGQYMCEVRAPDGGRRYSGQASLSAMSAQKKYSAKGKVALLVGNSNYKGAYDELRTVETDIRDMSEKLQKMGFAVVPAVNMVRKEMKRLLKYFSSLIGPGTYVFVYLAGHGFQYNMKTYLMAPDVQSDLDRVPEDQLMAKCLGIEEVKAVILRQCPTLVAIFADMCRTKRQPKRKKDSRDVAGSAQAHDEAGDCENGRMEVTEVDDDYISQGNLLTCFATSGGLSAYEDGEMSILVRCLLHYLHLKEPLKAVCDKVVEMVTCEMRTRRRGPKDAEPIQRPEVWYDMPEQRSLHDPIDYRGDTEAHNLRLQQWAKAASVEELSRYENSFRLDDSCINVYFRAPLANVLVVVVLTELPAAWSAFAEADIPEGMAPPRGKWMSVVNARVRQYELTIPDLQKLKRPLLIHILKQNSGPDQLVKERVHTIELKAPLLASLDEI